MTQITREEFHRIAGQYNVVPIWRHLLADLVTPVAAFARLCVADQPGFLLESVDHGGRWSRWSFIGRNPIATLTSINGRVSVSGDLPRDLPLKDGILATLDALLQHYKSPSIAELPPLHAGLVGHIGHDVVREVEDLPDPPHDDRHHPDAALAMIGELAAFDHWNQRVVLVVNVVIPPEATSSDLDQLFDEGEARLNQLAADGSKTLAEPLLLPPEGDELPEFHAVTGSDTYRQSVAAALEYIEAGEVSQVVVSQRFDVELNADPFDVYRVLRQINPSPYMFFIRQADVTLVGCSPEPLIQLLNGKIISRPIAGTRRRGKTDEDDRRLEAELREHPKEIDEHMMLVDLAKHDLAKIGDPATIKVDELMTLERYSHVMHLTSQVSAQLADGVSPIDVLRATLPAGTVSGAPKTRALEIIDELEPTKRGPYAGVAGYIDFSGNIDTAIAIRTMIVGNDGVASVQSGAGIVANSNPADEDLECRNKARALLVAIPPARRMTAARHAIK